VKVVVDGHNLSLADQMRVRSVWLYVTGDGDGGVIPQMYSTPSGLPGGVYTAVYTPHIKSGILDIMVTINDAAGAVIDMRQTKVTVRSGNQVMATVTFGATVDAGDDAGTSPPMGNGGNGGNGGGVAGLGGGAGAGGGGAGGDAPLPDGSVPDAPGADVPPTCATMACSGATADACCPAACTSLTDVDCAGCGNGMIDPGETCDPVASCKSECPQIGCQLFTLMGANTCQAACVAAGMQTMCVNGDGCCPTGCTTANDTDCSASCGNGVVEGQEICDGNCPTTCPPKGCQLQTLQGSAAACTATCVDGAMQTACANGDGCCPTGCVAANDSDCALVCGNGKIDPGEVCDGNCPTSCPAMGCTLRQLAGSAATCNATCATLASPQTRCLNGDGCCPATCNATNDNDCMPKCGNSVIERGETCDPVSACTTAATACVSDANTIATMSGSTAACTFVCTRTQRTCGPADTYCPTNITCGPTTDSDCPGCGNGRIETARGETCDPPSMCSTQMTACVSDKDNVRVSSGSTAACTYKCTTTPRTCVAGDGFCPTSCGPTTDSDCVGCGNGKKDPGETCDTALAGSCPTTCPPVNCTTQTLMNGGTCTAACVSTGTPVACSQTSDGCCSAGCNETTDADCAPANDLCANAIDISKGGDFPFNLTRAKMDSPVTCAQGGADIYYTFTLADPSYVYLDVYDGGKDAKAAIELYQISQGTKLCDKLVTVGCDSGAAAQKDCGTAGPWPRFFYVTRGGGLPAGSYVVVVRALGTPNGNQVLRFQRVPTDCAAGGALPTQATTSSTCTKLDLVAPTCAKSGTDQSYYLEKCPGVGVTASTCGSQTVIDTILQMNAGSVDVKRDANGTPTACVLAPSGSAVTCNDTSAMKCVNVDGAPVSPGASTITNQARNERGIITVTVDTVGAECGNFILGSSIVP